MELEFSSEQEQISSLFLAYRNDIDIYTEDEIKDKLFYKKIFSRLLDGTGLIINDVYPLGTSENVIDACRKDIDTERKKIYIVDGDIYLMFSPKSPMENLYVLDAYCMENLVIDEDSVCNTLCNFMGTRELEDIKNEFNFRSLIDVHKDSLISLFYYKALEKKYCGRFSLHSLARYYDEYNNIDLVKIKEEQESIKGRLIQKGVSEIEIIKELEFMEEKFPKNAETFLRIISGKDYLIHLVSCHAKKSLKYKTGHSKESWKYNFAQYCKLDRLEHLKSVLISL